MSSRNNTTSSVQHSQRADRCLLWLKWQEKDGVKVTEDIVCLDLILQAIEAP